MLITGTLSAFLLAFPALFSIVNPLSGAIIFNEVTAGQSHGARIALARQVAIYSTGIMLVSLWAGSYILSFFGITVNALRIAGGLVVAVKAYELLSAPDNHAARKEREAEPVSAVPPQELAGYAFFPLTLPFTTGPGTIAVTVALGAVAPDSVSAALYYYAGASLAVVAMAVLVWVSYTTAERFASVLGESGRQVVARIAAFLLLGIGVQITISGMVPVLHQALGR